MRIIHDKNRSIGCLAAPSLHRPLARPIGKVSACGCVRRIVRESSDFHRDVDSEFGHGCPAAGVMIEVPPTAADPQLRRQALLTSTHHEHRTPLHTSLVTVILTC